MFTVKKEKRFLSLLIAVALLFSIGIGNITAAEKTSINRFNVMVVVDASGSMSDTDPQGLRFDALGQFVNLLAENGNYLGGIIFSTDIVYQSDPGLISSQSEKDALVDALKSTKIATDTDIGEALTQAVTALKSKGDANLPSAIILLSDGNTDLPGDADALQQSLDDKATAVQEARNSNIPIYTICLNANNGADSSEMKQIADATGGGFQEVKTASDLTSVFKLFYGMIYGTDITTLIDNAAFPANGVLEQSFTVPANGVEELNLIIEGKVSSVVLTTPDGSDAKENLYLYDTYAFVKTANVTPGDWKVTVQGDPGSTIKVNLVFNHNLGVTVSTSPDLKETEKISPNENFVIKANLESGGNQLSAAEDYAGYNATVTVSDKSGKTVKEEAMTLAGDHFEKELSLPFGEYTATVNVKGNGVSASSDAFGPIPVCESLSDLEGYPKAVENPLTIKRNVWPWTKEEPVVIDMTTLAEDPQGGKLSYELVESTFDKSDYTVKKDEITLNQFSISTGDFVIRATNEQGLSCQIRVICKRINLGLWAAIGLGALILVGLIVLFIIWRVTLGTPFYGKITVESDCNGQYSSPDTVQRACGFVKLNAFNVDYIGLNPRKCKFQARGKKGHGTVWFKTDVPVVANGVITKKVEVGYAKVRVTKPDDNKNILYMSFQSIR